MKVLVLSTVHRWNEPRLFHKVACTLAREHEVILCAIGDGEERTVDNVLVRQIGTWRSRYDRLQLWRRARREILRIKPDVIHFHSPELALILLPVALFTRKKLIFDVHEDPVGGYAERKWIPKPLKGITKLVLPLLFRMSPRVFDTVILAEDSYIPHFLQRDNVHVIHNYAIIPDPDVPFRDHYRDFNPQKELRLVYFGQLTVQRGAWQMIEMAKILLRSFPSLHLDLIGEVQPRSLSDELERAASELGGAVRLHGFVEFNQAVASLQQAHLGLVPLQPHPNFMGSFSTKFFDYMTYGLPFVVTDMPFWRRFVEENPCGVVADTAKPEGFAETVIQLVQDTEKLRDLSHHGYRLVRDKFRWEAERLLQIYRDLESSKEDS
ncbi:MAG: glycosyltransferase family 4 protein [bacterium]